MSNEDFIEERFGRGYNSGVQYESGVAVVPTSSQFQVKSGIGELTVEFPNYIEVTTKEIFIDSFIERRLQGAAQRKLPNGERPISNWKKIWNTIRRLPT